MPSRKHFSLSAVAVLALCLPTAAFADSSCANVGTPVNGLVSINCNLYYNGTTNSFNLFPLMTQNGASLSNNDFVENYTVVINGNPKALADNSTGLFNQSLWAAVLYFPGGDPDGPLFSDMLQVFWPGNFPSASTVQSFNAAVFGALPGFSDSDFFVAATSDPTVIGAGTNVVFNVFTGAAAATPEPDSLILMGTGMLALCGLGGFARRRAGICATGQKL